MLEEVVRVAALREGDEGVFRDLVEAWSPAMLRWASTFVGGRADAQDVVQDTWLAVIKGLDRFEGRSSLRAWVFAIVANRARTHAAREARTVAMSQIAPEDAARATADPDAFLGADGAHPRHWTTAGVLPYWDTSPEQHALTAEALAVIRAAVARLPARQRSVVTLRDVLGMTSEEACAILVISPQNQRVLLHRGRRALRVALAGFDRRS